MAHGKRVNTMVVLSVPVGWPDTIVEYRIAKNTANGIRSWNVGTSVFVKVLVGRVPGDVYAFIRVQDGLKAYDIRLYYS